MTAILSFLETYQKDDSKEPRKTLSRVVKRILNRSACTHSTAGNVYCKVSVPQLSFLNGGTL